MQILTLEQEGLERELAEKRLMAGNRVEELREFARIYREEVKAGAKEINQQPQTPEEAALYFKWQRRIIDRFVERVDVNPDKSTMVHTKIALDIGVQVNDGQSLLNSDPESNSSRHSNLEILAR